MAITTYHDQYQILGHSHYRIRSVLNYRTMEDLILQIVQPGYIVRYYTLQACSYYAHEHNLSKGHVGSQFFVMNKALRTGVGVGVRR